MHAFPDLNIVIRFDDFLQAIGQRPVAGKNSGAARSEEITVLAGDAVRPPLLGATDAGRAGVLKALAAFDAATLHSSKGSPT